MMGTLAVAARGYVEGGGNRRRVLLVAKFPLEAFSRAMTPRSDGGLELRDLGVASAVSDRAKGPWVLNRASLGSSCCWSRVFRLDESPAGCSASVG